MIEKIKHTTVYNQKSSFTIVQNLPDRLERLRVVHGQALFLLNRGNTNCKINYFKKFL